MFAGDVLVRNAMVKVAEEDIILTYAFSAIVLNILLRAQQVPPHERTVGTQQLTSTPRLGGFLTGTVCKALPFTKVSRSLAGQGCRLRKSRCACT